jgi:hypothetical protein
LPTLRYSHYKPGSMQSWFDGLGWHQWLLLRACAVSGASLLVLGQWHLTAVAATDDLLAVCKFCAVGPAFAWMGVDG